MAMKKITSLFVAFGLAASFAAAGDGEGCPARKGSDAKPTALATARKTIADAKKADEKLPADRLAELKTLRDTMIQTPMGKAMGPSYGACAKLLVAAAAQPGNSAEAQALLTDMAATYCSIGKVFGGCGDCKECAESGECCKGCKQMGAEDLAKKATESLATAKQLMAAAMTDMEKMAPEEQQKVQAAGEKLMKMCPVAKAMQDANTALTDSYASLAKMGIPSAEGKNGALDEMVKSAHEIHTMLSSGKCEGAKEEATAGKP